MLIKGDGVKDRVESYFRDKNLLYDNVVHYPYEKSLGANYYVLFLYYFFLFKNTIFE
jgi:hypothetical protein